MSNDIALGIPFNLASYAMLLILIAKETGMKVGTVSGQLTDVHIYEQHLDIMNTQITRKPFKCPTLNIDNWTNIWDWDADDVSVEDYECHGKLSGRISI